MCRPTFIAAIVQERQCLVIRTEQVLNGDMDIVNVGRLVHRVQPNLIGGAVNRTALDAAGESVLWLRSRELPARTTRIDV